MVSDVAGSKMIPLDKANPKQNSPSMMMNVPISIAVSIFGGAFTQSRKVMQILQKIGLLGENRV